MTNTPMLRRDINVVMTVRRGACRQPQPGHDAARVLIASRGGLLDVEAVAALCASSEAAEDDRQGGRTLRDRDETSLDLEVAGELLEADLRVGAHDAEQMSTTRPPRASTHMFGPGS